MMKQFTLICSASVSTILSGQGIVRDARTGTIEVSLLADANFSVSEMNVDFTTRGTVDGSYTNALYYSALSSGKDIAVAAIYKVSPVVLGVQIFINFASAVLTEPNTQRRIYDLIIPTQGYYVLQCSLKGDIDNPRNRVRLVAPTGTTYIDYQESFSSNTVRAFGVNLPPGCYSAEVSLGSGSSTFFHTAGNLNYIHLWDAAPKQFSLPFVTAINRVNILDHFPSPGSTASMWVDFQGYPVSNPNIISGAVSYGNLRPYTSVTVFPDYPNSQLRAVNKPIHVIQPQFHILSGPSFSGTRATYQVQRDEDWEYDLYPDDWFDQDGDGIPDPPYGGY